VLISELRFITCDYGTTFTQVYPCTTHLLVRKSLKPGAALRGSAYPGIISFQLFTSGRSRENWSGSENKNAYM